MDTLVEGSRLPQTRVEGSPDMGGAGRASAAAAVSAYGCGAAGVQVVVTRHLKAASSAKTT